MDQQVLHISIPGTHHNFFDYHSLAKSIPNIGARVRVPFRNKECIGFIVGKSTTQNPSYKLKSILSIIDETPIIPPELQTLCEWVSLYYHAPLAEVLALALPKKIRLGDNIKPKIIPMLDNSMEPALALNTEQATAVSTIRSNLNDYHAYLLQGVTGSGKTEVYLHIISTVLCAGKQVLMLVPEIGLTPQLLDRVHKRYNVPMAVIHSHISDGKRAQAWQLAKDNTLKLIIGTRSALFTPMPALGLIIVDEEHDPSLKQMDGVRYSARDAALIRAHQRNIPIILGSATPSLESLHNVAQNKFTQLSLTQKALNQTPLHFQLIDLRNQPLEHGLSKPALAIIKTHLDQNHQVLIFINRRGFAPVLLCYACGWIADCTACDSHLTLHRQKNQLKCHHCGLITPLKNQCDACKSHDLVPIGAGTQRIQAYLSEIFPKTNIVRIDRDEVHSTKTLHARLDDINHGKAQLIIGTQMLAKGHHFPALSLVVVLDTDAGFYNHDFRALERLGQLITQVAGRAGRADHPGQVVIQTHLPDHPLLNQLIQQGYIPFSQSLLMQRQKASLPPYAFIALIRAHSKHMENILYFLNGIKKEMKHAPVDVLGPAPSPLARKAFEHHMQLLIKAKTRKDLHQALHLLRKSIPTSKINKGVKFTIDIDPIELS